MIRRACLDCVKDIVFAIVALYDKNDIGAGKCRRKVQGREIFLLLHLTEPIVEANLRAETRVVMVLRQM